jgi:major membrane immunogen (membrane-anchored lipoprotein)
MNENEVFRLKGRIAISNLSREDKDMINSILDDINKKDEDEKGYVYTVRVKLNNGKVVHATLFFKDKKGPTFEDLKKELDDDMGVKSDNYSNNGIIIINRIVMSGEEFDRFTGE